MSGTSTNILNVAKNSVVKHHLTTIEGTSDGLIKNSPRAQHTNHQITTFQLAVALFMQGEFLNAPRELQLIY